MVLGTATRMRRADKDRGRYATMAGWGLGQYIREDRLGRLFNCLGQYIREDRRRRLFNCLGVTYVDFCITSHNLKWRKDKRVVRGV